MQWTNQQLLVWSKQARCSFELNPTASLIWLLCSGALPVDEVVSHLQSLDQGRSDEIARDVRETLADLQAKGLLVPAREGSDRPTLCVGFSNFWTGFDVRDNYFVWSLSTIADVMIVDPWDQRLDVLFYSEILAPGVDHTQIGRNGARRVQVCLNAMPSFRDCDFAFSPHEVPAAHADQHFRLPLWALYVDWSNFAPSEGSLRDHGDLARYKPDLAAQYLRPVVLSAKRPASARLGEVRHHGLDGAPARKLTIGMAAFDEYDGTYFTIQAIRLFHPEVTRDTEILLVDNNPHGPSGHAYRKLASWVDGFRYIPHAEWRGTSVRDVIFREARTPYVLCLDAHVMLAAGTIGKLIAYFDAHPDTGDLLQGPLMRDDLVVLGTHFAPEWRDGMYGTWALDQRGLQEDADPFEIPMQGLGLFACRKEAWRGFNPRFRGFGGEEGYIHEKFRQAGHRTLCLPFLRWLHRFGRPDGVRYPTQWIDRIINYHLGFRELGLDPSPIDAHFRAHLGDAPFGQLKPQVEAECTHPLLYFDAIYCINLDAAEHRWRAMQRRFERLGISRRVRRFSAVETPDSHHVGCALSHRAIIEQARTLGLQQVLVLEDDAVFLDGAGECLSKTIPELQRQDWGLFYLGGHRWGREYAKVPGCDHLGYVDAGLTTTHAVAYHGSAYDALLAEIPATADDMRQWLQVYKGIDQYYTTLGRRYLSLPSVASQGPLLESEDPAYRHRFVL